MTPCSKCGNYHEGECDPQRATDYQNEKAIKQVKSDLTSLEAELAEYLQTKHGRFDLYYLCRQSGASRGKGTASGSSRT